MIRTLAILLLIAVLILAAKRAWGSEAQLQQWIDEATAAGRGEVTVPTGIVHIEKGLTITNATHLRLIGLDTEACILRLIADVPLLTLTHATHIHIEKLTLQGLSDPATHPLLTFSGKPHAPGTLHLSRCILESHTGPGLHLTHAIDTRIHTNTFMDLTPNAIIGGPGLSGLQIVHNHLARCPTAIHLQPPPDNLTLRANEFHHCTTPITGPPLPPSNHITPPTDAP